ncbi:MAG: putative glycosyltransferase [Rhodocyclales bacterium]|nr:putative glycosyltransferase [Rhodocyclales bacterium]
MNLIPIVIPYYKAPEKLKKCLGHIKAQLYSSIETFVRDNSEDNIYYTAAVNEGLLKYAFRDDVQYILVLNQDAYLEPDAVEMLVQFMDEQPDCGIGCPLQVDSNWSVTWGGSLNAFPAGKHKGGDISNFTEPAACYWANGACMMIRTSVIKEIGVFDKNMRFICSDSDFSFTARSRGWHVCVVPSAICEHSPGAAGSLSNTPLEIIKLGDIQYFLKKWLSADLYKELALEGPELTKEFINQYSIDLANGIARLKAQTSPVSS